MATDKPVQFNRGRRKQRRKSKQLLSQEDIREQIVSLLEQADKIIKTDNEQAQKLAAQARKL